MEVEIRHLNSFDTNIKSTDIYDFKNILNYVNNVIEKEGFVSFVVDKKFNIPEGSFLGITWQINIKGKTAKGEKETNLFLKIKNPNENMTLFSLSDIYKRERLIYRELSHIFDELQNEVKLPKDKIFKMVKSFEESNTDVIILENMAKKGYKTNFSMEVPSLEYFEMGIKELAKLHGLSFVLEAKRPDYFDKKIRTLDQPFHFNEEWDGYVENMCKLTLTYLNGECQKKLENFIPNFIKKYATYMTSRQRCLCHGDYRINNILVKQAGGKIIDLIPIDYQLIYYGCPVLDLIYFLFLSSDQTFRRKHLTYLKSLYYQSLKDYFNYFKLNINLIYPKEVFEEDFRDRLDYGLMVSINLIPLLISADDKPDLTEKPISDLNFNINEGYKDRLVEVVDDFIEWGYL